LLIECFVIFVECIVCDTDNTAMSETKLTNAPVDAISSVKFAPNSSQFLLVSSWDSTVRLYDVNENFLRMKYLHSTAVLDCCFQVLLQMLTVITAC